ncbi:MAG TPA: glycosyltransferase, partial [Brumimicrobium sp.]|nr:glycosyltransferase [Brumimicrobium sp.]
LPSQTESFGLAALEAMAVGVPVISSNTGGIPEVNKHGYSGYLSDVGNIDEMAENGIKILSDDKVLNQFKIQAQEQARQFSLEEVLPTYELLYKEVIEKFNAGKL